MPPSSSPRVLIADPDVECTALMGRQLEWAGYDVLATGDARDVPALVAECRPDAIVIEAMMHGTTGYAVVRELRAQPQNRLMPIVMISARAGKLDHDFAFTVGADAYVKKPFPYSEIVARLALLAPAAREAAPVLRRAPRIGRRLAQPVLATG